MGNPLLGVNTSVAFKLESSPGTRESITGGDISDEFLDTVSESLNYKPVSLRLPALANDRQSHGDFEFVSHNDGGGNLVCRPRHAHIDELLKIILGKLTTGVYTPDVDGTDLPKFTVECKKSGQIEVVLVGSKVNTATFKSTQNGPLELDMVVVASSGERNPGDLTTSNFVKMASETPYMHGGLALSSSEAWLGAGTPEPVRSIEFTLNNNLDTEAFCNSVNRSVIPVGVFELSGNMEVPYNSTTAGFWAEMIGANKVKFTMTYTDANSNTLAFAFVVKLEGDLPAISGPENVWLTLNFHGVMDATDADCISVTPS